MQDSSIFLDKARCFAQHNDSEGEEQGPAPVMLDVEDDIDFSCRARPKTKAKAKATSANKPPDTQQCQTPVGSFGTISEARYFIQIFRLQPWVHSFRFDDRTSTVTTNHTSEDYTFFIRDGFSTTEKGVLGSLQTSKRHKNCIKRRVVYPEYCRKITPL